MTLSTILPCLFAKYITPNFHPYSESRGTKFDSKPTRLRAAGRLERPKAEGCGTQNRFPSIVCATRQASYWVRKRNQWDGRVCAV